LAKSTREHPLILVVVVVFLLTGDHRMKRSDDESSFEFHQREGFESTFENGFHDAQNSSNSSSSFSSSLKLLLTIISLNIDDEGGREKVSFLHVLCFLGGDSVGHQHVAVSIEANSSRVIIDAHIHRRMHGI